MRSSSLAPNRRRHIFSLVDISFLSSTYLFSRRHRFSRASTTLSLLAHASVRAFDRPSDTVETVPRTQKTLPIIGRLHLGNLQQLATLLAQLATLVRQQDSRPPRLNSDGDHGRRKMDVSPSPDVLEEESYINVGLSVSVEQVSDDSRSSKYDTLGIPCDDDPELGGVLPGAERSVGGVSAITSPSTTFPSTRSASPPFLYLY